MGIKGLWKKVIADHASPSMMEVLPRGKTCLLVDATGFLFDLLDEQVKTLYSHRSSIGKEFGGIYKTIERIIGWELERLTDTLGLELIFYFDGPQSYYKGNTTMRRRVHILEQWNQMFYAVLGDGQREDVNQSKLPLPPLATLALTSLLERNGIQYIKTDFEADQEMAKDCFEGNSVGDKKHYCYTGDSDFLVMKDCPTICFGDLDHMPTETLSAMVWRRTTLARLYHVSEEQFVQFAIIAGNDFTQQFSMSMFGVPSYRGLNELMQRFVDNQIQLNVASISNADCRQAVRYSMAFYELEDLQPLMLDQYKTINTVDELTDLEAGIWLDNKLKVALGAWMAAHKKEAKAKRSVTAVQLGHMAIAFMASLNEDGSRNTVDIITPDHIDCLSKMLDAISTMSKTEPDYSGHDKLQYTDVKVANLYQLVVREIGKITRESVGDRLWAPILPSACFDGLAFHLLMEQSRTKAADIVEVNELFVPLEDLNMTEMQTTMTQDEPEVAVAHALLVPFEDLRLDAILVAKTQDESEAVDAHIASDLNTIYTTHFATNQAEKPAIREADQIRKKAAKAAKEAKKREAFFSRIQANSSNGKDEIQASQEGGEAHATPDHNNNVNDTLPADAFREDILEQLARDRVCIIHGEAGCGKSSRVPVFILEDCEKRNQHCMILIAQPRRIAVYNLKRRLQAQLGDKVGMRMGHGVREGNANTKIVFVTTGYLVKLIAHRPTALADITHVIIDEVHERSLDSDLLCWLARLHLASCRDTRLVLMSATMHTSLYANYFHDNVVMRHTPTSLSVGLRRFPVSLHHVEDLPLLKGLPPQMNRLCNKIAAECRLPKRVGDVTISAALAKLQYDAAMALIRSRGREGSAVLVFVSGIADIIEMQSRLDGLDRYELVAIHSEIPFEEQEFALTLPSEDKVRVIIATNAAESSVTLPNVDIVICLGTHKAINHKAGDLLRSTLENVWISKSSAIQRAGRTGRVRPGSIYRLYTKELYESFVDFEEAEIHRKPLHEVVLSLKATFQDAPDHTGVIPILSAMLEAPDLSKVDDCFQYLYDNKLSTAATDAARLTLRGRFAGSLPIDVSLSNLVMYGISLGVGAEAVVAAAALSQPKSPFRVAHPVVHTDPIEFNAIIRQTFLGAVKFDAGLYSDPILMVRLFVQWEQLETKDHHSFCQQHGLALARMKHFVSSVYNLLRHVQQLMKQVTEQHRGRHHHDDDHDQEGELLYLDGLDEPMTSKKLNRIRLSLLWALSHNLLRSESKKKKKLRDVNSLYIPKESSFNHRLLAELFPKQLIPRETLLTGKFVYAIPPPFQCLSEVQQGLRALFPIFAKEEDITFVCSSFTGTPSSAELDILQSVRAEIEGDVGIRIKRKRKKQNSPLNSFTKVVFAVRQRNDSSLEETFLEQIQSFVHHYELDYLGKLEYSGHLSLSMYSYDVLDDEAFYAFTSVLGQATGLLLNVTGPDDPATLTAFNIQLDLDALKSLYAPAELRVYERQLEQAATPIRIIDVEERVRFLDQPQGAADEATKKGKKKSKQVDSDEEDASDVKKECKLAPLFADLKLGMRLFNAYCIGQRDRKLRYRQIAAYKADTAAVAQESKDFVAPQRLVPGSAQWAKQKEFEQTNNEVEPGLVITGQAKPTFLVETFDAKPHTTRWKILADNWSAANEQSTSTLSDLPTQCSWNSVMMSCRSIVTSSYQTQPGPCLTLFAVAYSAITIIKQDANQQVMVEGITVFPPGEDWIHRALLCAGKRLNAYSEVTVDCDLPDDRESVKNHITFSSACAFIRNQLDSSLSRSIAENDVLIQSVDLVFADLLAERPLTAEEKEKQARKFRKLVRHNPVT